MKKSLAIGSFLGVLLTLAAGYYFYVSKIVEFAPSPATAPTSKTAVAADDPNAVEPAGIPIVAEFPQYQTEFPGDSDLIAQRNALSPFATPETWDKAMDPTVLPPVRTSSDCAFADLSRAIYIPAMYTEAVKAGKMNIQFLNARVPKCFSSQNTVIVAVDDLLGDKTLYQILGQAVVERLVEARMGALGPNVLSLFKLNSADVDFLRNPLYGPMLGFTSPFLVMQYKMQNQPPILDPTVIPPFVPGADVLKADSVTRFFASFPSAIKAHFVDARDRKNISSGASYPGAITAPFISSNPNQLNFQMDFPLSALSGGRYDIRAIPPGRDTPLVIFGNDANDPAPLWMIRYLRLQNYRTLFYVEGGLKAMNEAKPVLRR